MRAGRLRDRVVFKTNATVDDGMGGQADSWVEVTTVWGEYKPNRGREVAEGDRTNAIGTGILKVRQNFVTDTITEADIVEINNLAYQIRGIDNPDRRGRMLEIFVERGVIT